MSHSVPSESSAVDTTFIVGADLVEFDRPELPIYQTPESQVGRRLLRRGAATARRSIACSASRATCISTASLPTSRRQPSPRCRAKIRWSFWLASPTG